MHNYGPAFFFENQLVGMFEEGIAPAADGVFQYMPTRDPGHLQLVQRLRNSSNAECYYKCGEEKVWFKVTEIPGYATVRLMDFRRE